MNIGLAGMFPWRPHLEHLVYIGILLRKSSHKTFYLTCDSQLSNCYNLELKKQGRTYVCGTCIIGGIRSYPVNNITPLEKNVNNNLSELELLKLSRSSANTLCRAEAKEEFEAENVLRIRDSFTNPINIIYENTTEWIKKNKIEGIITFNGRMDITQGITYACEKNDIPYITLERTRDHGILLKPNENCLGLKEINRLNKIFINIFKIINITSTRIFERIFERIKSSICNNTII